MLLRGTRRCLLGGARLATPSDIGFDWFSVPAGGLYTTSGGNTPASTDGDLVGRVAVNGPRNISFTRATDSLRPVYGRGRLCSVTGAADQVITSGSVPYNSQAVSIAYIIDMNSLCRGYIGSLFQYRCLHIGGSNLLNLVYDGIARQMLMSATSGGGASSLRVPSSPTFFGAFSTPGGVIVRINDQEETVAAVGAGTGDGFRMLSDVPDGSGLAFQGGIYAGAYGARTTTLADRELLYRWSKQPPYNVVSETDARYTMAVLGDSRCVGFLSAYDAPWVSRMNTAGAVVFNYSEAGCRSDDLAGGGMAAVVLATKQVGKKLIVHYACGINDILAGRSAQRHLRRHHDRRRRPHCRRRPRGRTHGPRAVRPFGKPGDRAGGPQRQDHRQRRRRPRSIRR
jgi:hypothetical protein